MAEVNNTQLVASVMGRWEPRDLAWVETLHLVPTDEGSADLRIVGLFQRRGPSWPSPSGETHRVTMLFEGVRELRLRDFGGGCTQIVGFSIADISDRGWEGVRFEIDDDENGRIRFVCDSATIEGIERASPP